MRERARIRRILRLIEGIWKDNQDLRLFQLLGNPLGNGDHYHIKDEDLEVILEAYYLGKHR